MPKISVVIPVYNVECFLSQCLDSVLGQTLSDIEVICVDDGSTDGSVEILEKYAAEDVRLSVVHQENRYAGVARNNGLKAAHGEYLLFLDADDFFEPFLCEKAYKAAKERKADIVLFSADRFDERSQSYCEANWYLNTGMLPDSDSFSGKDTDGNLLRMTFLGTWNKLFRREFIECHGLEFQPLHNSNDDYFVAVALSLADRITAINDVLTHHRFGLTDNLQSRKHQYPLCFLEAYEAIYDKLQAEGVYESVERGFVSRVLTDCVYHLKTMRGADAKREICKNLCENHFTRMRIMDYENPDWSSQKNKQYIQGMLHAYECEADFILCRDDAANPDACFPDYCDYYAAWSYMLEGRFQDYNDAAKIKIAELNEKLQRTYREKSEINAKLQQTYREKAERGTELKELKSHFLVKADRKLHEIFKNR